MTSHLRVDLPTGYTRPTLQQILKADRQVFMYLIRIGAQLKRLPDNQLDLDSQLFQALQSYEVGFHLLPLPKAMPQQVQQPSTQSTAPQGGNYGAKGSWHGARPQPYKGKVDMGMAKANQKAARASCRSSCLDVTTQTWICMEDACASTIRLGSALKLPMEENVQEGGTCAAGRVVTPLTRRRSTTIRRSDNLTASGP